MIRIQIQRDGSVTGDVNAIAAYEGQTRSEKIQFLHPSYPGALYKVKYTWGTTVMEDMLDGNDTVQIYINGTGIVRLTFIAENALTGENIMSSHSFSLVVHQNLRPGPNHFSSCPPIPHRCPPPIDCGGDPVTGLMKLAVELNNEQIVRGNSISQLWEAFYSLRQELVDAGVIGEQLTPETLDCNKLVATGPYLLASTSINTPIEGKCFRVSVSIFNAQVLQTAHIAEQGLTGIFYRTGTRIDDECIEWQEWVPMIHEASITEIE